MSKIFISGLVNIEATCSVDNFPIEYCPIEYNFHGVNIDVAGVGYNIAKAMKTLGDDVDIATIIGNDLMGKTIVSEFENLGINTDFVKNKLEKTCTSNILYDRDGRRKIYCDLKNIQETEYGFCGINFEKYDIIVACNINYNRQLLKALKTSGKTIATDVHVLTDINDKYNREFMEAADILFLSDEGIQENPEDFIRQIESTYHNDIIVLGQGSKGALMYVKKEDKFYDEPAKKAPKVVNTVGAGDSLFSCFISSYAKGMTPVEALDKAQAFAAYKIGFDGAANGFKAI